MTDTLTETEPPEGDQPSWRRKLEADRDEARAERDAIRAELDNLRRDKAFDDLGIPTTGPGALLRKSYDGDLDTEAIKAQALEYGILEPDPPPQPNVDPGELAQHQRASEAVGITEPPPDDLTKIESAQTREELVAYLAQTGRLKTDEG